MIHNHQNISCFMSHCNLDLRDLHPFLFIRIYFIRISRLKNAQKLRISQEYAEAQLDLDKKSDQFRKTALYCWWRALVSRGDDEGYSGRGHYMCIEASHSCLKVVISLSVRSYKLSTILEKQF